MKPHRKDAPLATPRQPQPQLLQPPYALLPFGLGFAQAGAPTISARVQKVLDELVEATPILEAELERMMQPGAQPSPELFALIQSRVVPLPRYRTCWPAGA